MYLKSVDDSCRAHRVLSQAGVVGRVSAGHLAEDEGGGAHLLPAAAAAHLCQGLPVPVPGQLWLGPALGVAAQSANKGTGSQDHSSPLLPLFSLFTYLLSFNY
jgi:hypothetical protein